MKFFANALIIATFAVPSSSLFAQKVQTFGGRQMVQLDADKAVILAEIGAIVTEQNGKVKVLMIPPADRRPPGMVAVDLQVSDEIGMAGGKTIKGIKDLRDVYEHAEVGKEFKLGVRRDGQSHLCSFEKKDKKDMPQGGNMVIRGGPGKGDENSEPYPALGIRIQNEKSGVVISEVFPNAPENFEKGDVVKSVNGSKIGNILDVEKAYLATKIGDNLDIELVRGGKQLSIKTKRPQPIGATIRN
jgi:S1-C subfamily serine protease